jgi:hypothetical protein
MLIVCFAGGFARKKADRKNNSYDPFFLLFQQNNKIFEMFFTMLGFVAAVFHLCEKPVNGLYAQIFQDSDPLPAMW